MGYFNASKNTLKYFFKFKKILKNHHFNTYLKLKKYQFNSYKINRSHQTSTLHIV